MNIIPQKKKKRINQEKTHQIAIMKLEETKARAWEECKHQNHHEPKEWNQEFLTKHAAFKKTQFIHLPWSPMGLISLQTNLQVYNLHVTQKPQKYTHLEP